MNLASRSTRPRSARSAEGGNAGNGDDPRQARSDRPPGSRPAARLWPHSRGRSPLCPESLCISPGRGPPPAAGRRFGGRPSGVAPVPAVPPRVGSAGLQMYAAHDTNPRPPSGPLRASRGIGPAARWCPGAPSRRVGRPLAASRGIGGGGRCGALGPVPRRRIALGLRCLWWLSGAAAGCRGGRPAGLCAPPVGAAGQPPRGVPLRRHRVRAWAGQPRPRLGRRGAGSWAPVSGGLRAPLRGIGRPCRLRPCPAPLAPRPWGPPARPSGRPAHGMGRRASSLGGARVGRPGAALGSRARPTVKGKSARPVAAALRPVVSCCAALAWARRAVTRPPPARQGPSRAAIGRP